MKKYLAVFLGVIFILSFAVTAFAQDKPEITIGGELRERGWYLKNDNSSNLPTKTGSQAWYEFRVRLNVQANVTANTMGFVQLESDTEKNGTLDRQNDNVVWGSFNQKPGASMTFRQAYILHKGSGLLGIPLGIKVGHQLVALGEKQFLDHTKYGDDSILLFADPTKELHLALVVTKAFEGATSDHGDDIDAYVLLGTFKLDKDNTLGLNYTLIHSDALKTGTPPVATVDSLNFQNLGAHANGKVAGLAYAIEGDFQFGKAKGLPGEEDSKFSGYGIMAKLGYKLDPINIRASFAMGSGDDDPNDDKNKEFQATMGRDVHYTFNYEYTVRTAAANQVITAQPSGRSTSIANTTYYNLGVDFAPVKDLSLALDGYILRATKANIDGQSKNVGSEVDLGIAYKIDKNLTYSVTAGAFWPGKFYNDLVDHKKTVTQAVHALTLSF